MKKNYLVLLVLLVFGLLMLTGCADDTVDAAQAAKQEQAQKDMDAIVGMPSTPNWTEKKLLKDIIELRDKADLITYVYTQAMDGKFVYMGQGKGFGIPYSTQYTNPERVDYRNGNVFVLPQSDPNGLFSSSGVAATWIQYIDWQSGETEVMYAEPNLVVRQTPFPARMCTEWSLPDDYSTLK